jgi:hypothetical protein
MNIEIYQVTVNLRDITQKPKDTFKWDIKYKNMD